MSEKYTRQGNFKGVNWLCKDCRNTCKQFENVTIFKCPIYTPKKSVTPKQGVFS